MPGPRNRPRSAMPEDERVSVLRVTTVCSGNICRSPIAEYVLRRASRTPVSATRSSSTPPASAAGTSASPPTVAPGRCCGRTGTTASPHRVQQITRLLVRRRRSAGPDLLLAMDARTTTTCGGSRRPASRSRMMRAFDPALDGTAPTRPTSTCPTRTTATYDGFEDVLAMIEAATPGTVATGSASCWPSGARQASRRSSGRSSGSGARGPWSARCGPGLRPRTRCDRSLTGLDERGRPPSPRTAAFVERGGVRQLTTSTVRLASASGCRRTVDLVGADGLDRRDDRRSCACRRRAAGGLDGVGDVGDGDRAEQPAGVAGARRRA